MDLATHLAFLDKEGASLRTAAERAGLDAAVPSCPGWRVRELVQHVGQVHRWATSYVVTARTTPPNEHDSPAEPPSADDDVLPWFTEGHAALVQALRDADDGLDCWAFLPAPSPRAFWTRRQAHETTVHRTDVELAAGMKPTCEPGLAADGIDELLFGFFARPRGRLLADPAVRLGLRGTDTGDAWTMTIGPDARSATRDAGEADCVVSGPAADLYLLLWNRLDASGCDVDGDASVLQLWREKAHITWR